MLLAKIARIRYEVFASLYRNGHSFVPKRVKSFPCQKPVPRPGKETCRSRRQIGYVGNQGRTLNVNAFGGAGSMAVSRFSAGRGSQRGSKVFFANLVVIMKLFKVAPLLTTAATSGNKRALCNCWKVESKGTSETNANASPEQAKLEEKVSCNYLAGGIDQTHGLFRSPLPSEFTWYQDC